MSDMKKLMMGNTHMGAKAAQHLSLESLAEAAAAETIDLAPIDPSQITGLRRIRAMETHRLLAYSSNQGILLYDNRSGLQHVLTLSQWQSIIEITKKR